MSTETKGVMIYDLNAFEILIVLSIQTILIFMMLFMFMIKTFLPDLHFVPIIIIVSFTIHQHQRLMIRNYSLHSLYIVSQHSKHLQNNHFTEWTSSNRPVIHHPKLPP